jgi:hypothetical protein
MENLKGEQRMKDAAETAQKMKEDAQKAKKLEEFKKGSDHDDNDLMRRGAIYAGAGALSAWMRYKVHQQGQSKAAGYERSFLGLMQNFKQFKKAPKQIKAATLIALGTGTALSTATEFIPKLKQKIFGKKEE